MPESLEAQLRGFDLPVTSGCVWTTDAPYRGTREQLEYYATKGMLAVEMQAASLFAFAEARGAFVGLVAHVTNATDQAGQPFDKGAQDFGFRLFDLICRAGLQVLTTGSADLGFEIAVEPKPKARTDRNIRPARLDDHFEVGFRSNSAKTYSKNLNAGLLSLE